MKPVKVTDSGSFQLPGKPEWQAMLRYVVELHRRSVRPPLPPFPHAWEEIGPGYCYGPAFGHWDIVHAILDVLPFDPEHARRQIENTLAAQEDRGLLPGSIWIREGKAEWNRKAGHPPVWPFCVQDYCDAHGTSILPLAFRAAARQIRWFERERKAEGEGFYYTDILNHSWESGVDEGIRFLNTQPGPFACVDATSHMYAMYTSAQKWGQELGEDVSEYESRAGAVRAFIQNELYSEETGFFHDIWSVNDPALRCLALEGMWPVVVGAATARQAQSVIERNLLDPTRFFTAHPVSTVSLDDPRFELRMWRGPAWNSMTYWAARGCMNYGYRRQASLLLERALDDSAAQFERTGTIWEFYHPHAGRPEDVQRKPHSPFNLPCRDYLGHNPLVAMARLYEHTRDEATSGPSVTGDV